MSDQASHIRATLTAVRPQVLGALVRYFRDLDIAEEALQVSCLKALQVWPTQGPPRNPSAWLILVGRNAGIDENRRRSRAGPLPPDSRLPMPDDSETAAIERLDGSHFRDDILRLLFVCCHPDLPVTQQIALALRIVSGMPATRIARAFLVNERTMQQRITRAKATIAAADVPFETPTPLERTERLTAVTAIIYLIFNEGYSTDVAGESPRSSLCIEALRLVRILLGLFPTDPELMGLTALMLLHQARIAARFDAKGNLILLDKQDRSLWDRNQITEGVSLIDKAMRHRSPGPYQIQAAIVALHVRASETGATDWKQIEHLYVALERLQPSPVIRLNRAVAVAETSGPEVALDLIGPLEGQLAGYFNYFGVKGSLLMRLGRTHEARAAFDQAISLAHTPADAIHIRHQLDLLSADCGGSLLT